MFTKKDYQSNNGMITAIWGPSMWHFLHTISFNYPMRPTKEEKQHYRDFMNNLQNILPCKYCRENYKKNLKNAGWSMKSLQNRDAFSKFVYRLHNEVNKQLGKRNDLTYQAVRDRYEGYRSRCLSTHEMKELLNSKKEKGCIHPLYGESRRAVICIRKKSDCRGLRSSIQDNNKFKRKSKRKSKKSFKNQ